MILVTGINGQLGQEIIANQQLFSMPIKGVSRDTCDIRNRGAIMQTLDLYKPSIVINTAAYTAVDKAESESDLAYASNQMGCQNLARECEIHNIPLIHISTDYVFDGTKEGAYLETDPVSPIGVYGKSKLAGEDVIRELCKDHYILRTAWVYGAFGNNFMKTMIRLGKEREELRVVADQYGNPTATKDIVEALVAVCNSIKRGEKHNGIYHMAGSETTSWHGFASEIINQLEVYTGKKPKVTGIATHEYPTPAKRPNNSVLSNDKFIKTFGFTPKGYRQRIGEILKVLEA